MARRHDEPQLVREARAQARLPRTPPVAAHETQVQLARPDVLGERGLAQVQRPGRPAEAPGPRDREEDLELAERHGSGFPYRSDLNFRLELIAHPGRRSRPGGAP